MRDTVKPEQTFDLGQDLTIMYYRFTQGDQASVSHAQLARQLARVHHAEAFPGPISIQYLADPDPIASWLRQSEVVHLMALHHSAEGVIGFGTCLERPGFSYGRQARLGYFASLKLLPAWRTKVRRIASVYRWMYELTRGSVDLWYTTILSDNEAALKLLTKERKSMPSYLHQGTYKVFCFSSRRSRNDLLPTDFSMMDDALLMDRDLCVSGSGLSLLGDAVHYQAQTSHAYLLDLRPYKQYRLADYSGSMRLISKLPFHLVGYPRWPAEGNNVDWVAGHITLGDPTNIGADTAELLSALRAEAHRQDANLLLIGAMSDDALSVELNKYKHVSYTSELFLVDWEKQGLPHLQDISLDVAFL